MVENKAFRAGLVNGTRLQHKNSLCVYYHDPAASRTRPFCFIRKVVDGKMCCFLAQKIKPSTRSLSLSGENLIVHSAEIPMSGNPAQNVKVFCSA